MVICGVLYAYFYVIFQEKNMNDDYCKICGQGNETDHSKCHMIAMERIEKPCEHDNARITLSGMWQCLECGAILDEGSY